MAITTITRHDNCTVYIRQNEFRHMHYAQLRCKQHNVCIQHLSEDAVEQLKTLGVELQECPQHISNGEKQWQTAT
jgi:hypothetical protein